MMSKKQLILSVVIAFAIGVLILLIAVLPAEYGKDPLGTGQYFGFSRLYMEDAPIDSVQAAKLSVPLKFKKLTLEKLGSSASVPKPIEADNPPSKEQYALHSDTITVIVKAGTGIEYKFKANKYASVKYQWNTTDEKIVYIDFHGEVKQENPPENVFYESYTLAYSNNMAGTFTAPFEGRHGWYFRNKNKEDVTITIRLKGQYMLSE